jgi:hypothetical protein
MARLDSMSRFRNLFVEGVRTDLVTSPDTAPDLQLVVNNTVDSGITLPPAGFGDASITNWDVAWTNASYRPTATLVGTSGVNERVRVTWPAGSFNNLASAVTAYWRPWGAAPLSAPGAFYFEAEVEDVDGNIAAYCAAREAAGNRQTSICGVFVVEATGSAITAFSLWDQFRRKLSGEVTISDSRSDISPGFNAWTPGMGDAEGNAPQSAIHTMDIHQLRFWKF